MMKVEGIVLRLPPIGTPSSLNPPKTEPDMPLTPRQIANRANAQKSTGPKTEEGKAKSSLNALKHGLAAARVVLPNEDVEAYRALIQGWIDDLQPSDTAEFALVERAAIADWRLKRCVRAETARLSVKVRHAVQTHDLAQFARAEELGNRLIYDPLNRCHVPADDPETLRKLLILRAINPALIVREMESFSEGVDWMLKRWARLSDILGRESFWHYPEKFEAIKLLGQRPDDALNVEIVGKITMACRMIHPQTWDITAEVQQAALGCEGRPVYFYRTELLEASGPKSREEAFETIYAIIQKELIRLIALREKLAPLAEADRLGAEERAMFDDSKEGVLALRYESARDRELHRARGELSKKRKDEGQAAKRVEKEVVVEPEVVEANEVVKNRSTRRTAPPNEAKAVWREMSPKPPGDRKSRRQREKSERLRAT